MPNMFIKEQEKQIHQITINSLFSLGICYFILNLFDGHQALIAAPRLFLQEIFFIGILAETVFYSQYLTDNEAAAAIENFFLNLGILLLCVCLTLVGLFFYPPYHLRIYYFIADNRLAYVALFLLLITIAYRASLVDVLEGLYAPQKVLILGEGDLAQETAGAITNSRHPKFQLVGFAESFIEDGNEFVVLKGGREKEQLSHLVKVHRVAKIVVSGSQRRGCFPGKELLTCKMQGVEILEAQDIYEELTGKIKVRCLRPSWLIFTPGFRKHPITILLKRLLDVVVAFIGLVLCAPLLLVVASLIKIDSKGPALFRQERVGEKGVNFILLKFRTMFVNAEQESGPVWAQENDRRITRVGRIIRKLRMDEIPQLINVLRGEMSFVGPRPERPFFVEKLQKVIPYYTQRLSVKPGITGWAAVNYQYCASVDDSLEKLEYDLYYIKNRSLFLDLFITLKTINVILTGKGSR